MKSKVTLIRSRAIDSAIFKLADTLFKNGYEVQLLIWDRQNNLNVEDYPYKIHKFNLKAPYDTFFAILYLPLWWIYEFFFLLRHDSNIIHSCDFDTLWPAVIAKKIKGNVLFYTIYDFYANNLTDGSYQLIRNVIRNLISFAEKLGIKFTDTLFLADESRYDEVKGAKIKKVIYIYNSPPDYSHYSKNKNKSKVSVFYGGLITKSRGLDHFINAVHDLEDVELVIAGTGEYESTIKQLSKKYDNITYLGWLPSYKDIIDESFQSDIIFRFSDPKIPKTKYESPNKLFEAMMCEKPIIVSDYSSMATIVQKENCGIVIPYGNIQAIKNNIVKLRDDKELRVKLGKNGRYAYENKYSWNIMEERIIKAYNGAKL